MCGIAQVPSHTILVDHASCHYEVLSLERQLSNEHVHGQTDRQTDR